MATNFDGRLNFILWTTWYYPGLIVVASMFCRAQVKALKDNAVHPSTDTGKDDESYVHVGNDSEPQHHHDDSQPDDVARTEGSDAKTDSSLPITRGQSSSEATLTTRTGIQSRSQKPTSLPVTLKWAIFWQVTQIILLERMGHTAAQVRTDPVDPIFVSVTMLGICSVVVMLSLADLQGSWGRERGGAETTERDEGKRTKKPEPSSWFVSIAVLSVLVPWSELMVARYWA